jgi:hypothetical protein
VETYNKFPSHPAIRPLPTRRQKQTEKQEAIVYSGLNILTSIMPITALGIILRFKDTMMPWWFFVSTTSIDLAFIIGVVAILQYCDWNITRVANWCQEYYSKEVYASPQPPTILCDECLAQGRRGSSVFNWFQVDCIEPKL